MRDISRIDLFLNQFGLLWKTCFKDLRFGQLMYNFFSWLKEEKKTDGFYYEESQMMELFKEFCKINNSKAYKQFEDVTNNDRDI